jgi:hypothetical protein
VVVEKRRVTLGHEVAVLVRFVVELPQREQIGRLIRCRGGSATDGANRGETGGVCGGGDATPGSVYCVSVMVRV